MNKFNLVMTFILLAIMIRVIMRNNSENFQTNSQVALNNATLSYGNVPSGTIVSWSPKTDLTPIPTGWVPCDGTPYDDSDGNQQTTPNLIGRFVLGATHDATKTNDGTTDVWDDNFNPSNGDTGGKQKVALTEEEMPSHTHSGTTGNDEWVLPNGDRIPITNHKFTSGLHSKMPAGAGQFQAGTQGSDHRHIHDFITDEKGGGEAHENMPPYYSLIYIMKKY